MVLFYDKQGREVYISPTQAAAVVYPPDSVEYTLTENEEVVRVRFTGGGYVDVFVILDEEDNISPTRLVARDLWKVE